MISRTIMFRGQIRKKGEKVTYGGIPLPGIWVTGGIFPQNGTGDKAIIYSQKPAVEKYVVYADTVGQYTGVSDLLVIRFMRTTLYCSILTAKAQYTTVREL